MIITAIRINIISLAGKFLLEDLDQIEEWLKDFLQTKDLNIDLPHKRYEMIVKLTTSSKIKIKTRYKIFEKILEFNKERCEIGFIQNNSLYVNCNYKHLKVKKIF